MAGIEDCPVSHPLVKFALEGAKRRLARLVQPKEPLSVSTVTGDSYAFCLKRFTFRSSFFIYSFR